ncbi:MAG: amino acid racemase [Niabella sp.]
MIGIVGGVGPLAGVDIVTKIIEETTAGADQEHLPVILSSQPHRIVDRTEYLLGKTHENPAFALVQIIRELEKAGATVVAIPCNTAHSPRIFNIIRSELDSAGCKVKLLNMAEETASHILKHQGNIHVGVLSTTGTRNTGLYRNILERYGLIPVELNYIWQEKIHAAVYDTAYGIKAFSSPVSNRARREVLEAIDELKNSGAQAVILGCTELPLAIREKKYAGLPVIDPNRILARALIRELDPEKLKTTG